MKKKKDTKKNTSKMWIAGSELD
jgi:hypothetical protein